eukprot:CAMPEP_0118947704 /NCGR_PEP_ID=MMETSP1169-20130426/46526_1 /TAXON_ID=36882 /ORGANISM="Pyramimonas obovata, Strain CCMP722" /LENGTH=230 /DNA_ID=CAMNT_0006893971 /DNA_START=21 /DNA_END=710 /DNA_ORIENTATION=+
MPSHERGRHEGGSGSGSESDVGIRIEAENAETWSNSVGGSWVTSGMNGSDQDDHVTVSGSDEDRPVIVTAREPRERGEDGMPLPQESTQATPSTPELQSAADYFKGVAAGQQTATRMQPGDTVRASFAGSSPSTSQAKDRASTITTGGTLPVKGFSRKSHSHPMGLSAWPALPENAAAATWRRRISSMLIALLAWVVENVHAGLRPEHRPAATFDGAPVVAPRLTSYMPP